MQCNVSPVKSTVTMKGWEGRSQESAKKGREGIGKMLGKGRDKDRAREGRNQKKD